MYLKVSKSIFVYFNKYEILELLPYFWKSKISTFCEVILHGFIRIQINLSTIRCAIKLYIKFVNTVFDY
jgi:hypothetical protein